MKKLILHLCILLTALSGYGQSLGLQYSFREFMVNSQSAIRTKELLDEFKSKGGSDRFMYEDWKPGGATNNYGNTLDKGFSFNYDFLGNELYAKWNDTSIIVNTNYVKSFYLIDLARTHYFIKCPAIDPSGQLFYEWLSYRDGVSADSSLRLLKVRTIKVIKADKRDYMANSTGNFTDKMSNHVSYAVVFPDGSSKPVKLNKKSLQEVLATDKAKALIAGMSKVNEDSAGQLVASLNE